MPESKVESDQLKSSVNDDRRFYIQALIVRVMKKSGELSHNLLIEQVIKQSAVRFKPTIAMIKTCLESLLEKQFIARSDDDNDQYIYIS